MRSRKVIFGENGGVGLRKLLPLGRGAAVSIPKEFLEKYSLRAGDEVAIMFNGELIVRPIKPRKVIKNENGSR